MIIDISADATALGSKAAQFTAAKLNDSIRQNGGARLLLSTGRSQFETLQLLLNEKVEWEKVEVFHLDEYLGIPVTHNASFRKYHAV